MSKPPPLKYGKLQCSGTGFTFGLYTRESPAIIKAELGVHGTPSQIPPRRDRWEAQVRLYGVECSTWTIEGMKNALKARLKKGELRVSNELAHMEQVYNDKYHSDNQAIENAASGPQRLTRLSPEEARTALNDPTRLFWEVRTLGKVKGLPGFGWRQRKRIHQAAGKQGLCTHTISGDLLLVARSHQDLGWAVRKEEDEAAERARAVREEMEARRRAREAEIDRKHQETVESGEKNIAGMWILSMPTYRIWNNAEFSMQITEPCDGTMWATYNILQRGVLQIEWNGLEEAEEKTFEWTKTSGVDTFDFDYDNHKGKGMIRFTSLYTCEGTWNNHEFTGKKVSNLLTATCEQCKAECDKATKKIIAMKEKWEYMERWEYSEKERWKFLASESSDSD